MNSFYNDLQLEEFQNLQVVCYNFQLSIKSIAN